jgi:hypothetical protein
MNLRLIKNAASVADSEVLEQDIILEKRFHESRYPGVQIVSYYLFNVQKNTRYEILPEVQKLDLFKIQDTDIHKNYLYFIKYKSRNDMFTLIRYDWRSREWEEVYAFEESIDHFINHKHMSIFILGENNILLQTEAKRTNLNDNYEGYFDFSLTLYNRMEDRLYEVVDDNFIRNGITEMIPVTDTVCVMKTGYSLFEDNRYEVLDKMEVSVENICLVNVAQLVSDLILGQNGIVMDSIDQAYYKQTIPYVKVVENYVIYSKIDNETNEENITFYDVSTKQIIRCLNRGVVSREKMGQPIILRHKPFMQLNRAKKTDFLSLNSQEITLTIPITEQIHCVLDDIIIISERKKGLFGKEKTYLNVYKYPSMTLLHSEKCIYENALMKDGIVYLFIK